MSQSEILIVGSGVIGLTAALYLTEKYPDVKIKLVAREMPPSSNTQRPDSRALINDNQPPNMEWTRGQWASPWAGAIFHPTPNVAPWRQRLETESFRLYWKWSNLDVTAGIEQRQMRAFYDSTSLVNPKTGVWAKKLMPKFRWLQDNELPGRGVTHGAEYTSINVNPWVYLPWLRQKLESEFGVKFIRAEVSSLTSAVQAYKSPNVTSKDVIVVNATGLGSRSLNDVQDENVVAVRGQTMWVKTSYAGPQALRTGEEYTYCIPRTFSGGIILGGISQPDNTSLEADEHLKGNILERIEDLMPEVFEDVTSKQEEGVDHGSFGLGESKFLYKGKPVYVMKDIVGFRPGKTDGFRLEREGSVIHAYGFEGEGYIYSGGVARAITDYVGDILSFKQPRSKL
ncbi:nucleotide-binding domain-containing protein [Nadsonia fulvescens var. elongata DSM 6958]|uniref:Nucleotide-binding domain-containing protein n=1 Tax=Nadsonia fulvescens var. elongata DSM 6958 TaxID=857566 RepID=A0A1E3PRA5_9ASCO|nr:nucleotide-binding domain-containing protein [Nadsonia fulvescens var. elongata DSM 6958]